MTPVQQHDCVHWLKVRRKGIFPNEQPKQKMNKIKPLTFKPVEQLRITLI